MTGEAIAWWLGAALVMVASVAIWRLARPSGRIGAAHRRADPLVHLFMALGMAAMLLPGVGRAAPILTLGFGAVGAVMLARGRLHHAVMSAIMVLMIQAQRVPAPASPRGSGAMHMAMATSGHGASPLLLTAFGYAAVSACVLAWRSQGFAAGGATAGAGGGSRPCAVDPLGRGCEIMMLVSTAVMLLPMI